MTLPSIEHLQQEIAAIETQMADPVVIKNAGKMKELAHQLGRKQELLTTAKAILDIRTQQAEVDTLLKSEESAELRTLAEEDQQQLLRSEAALVQQLQALLIPHDPKDARDVILEIRAGAGGEEAALFAAELFRAYSRYAELAGWKVHTVSTSLGEQGGFKEVVAEIAGKNVFGTLKYERGVHRVQRVPATEKMGRTHTSTVTVAILPQAEEVDLEIRKEDLRIDTYRSSGAGGQHVNKTSSAIRITHLPTNTVVAVQDERSQHKNKDKAMSILRSRLLEAKEEAARSQEASERKQQVGTGDRSEKIRTYNFPQDRVTDHRIKQSWSNIPAIMNGEWEQIFTDIKNEDHAMKLAAATKAV